MKKLFITILTLICLNSCSLYREQFTYYEDGSPNHTVDVSFYNFFMLGKAGKLSTETQTMEFIRTVNAQDLENKVDSDSVSGVTEGITKGLFKP